MRDVLPVDLLIIAVIKKSPRSGDFFLSFNFGIKYMNKVTRTRTSFAGLAFLIAAAVLLYAPYVHSPLVFDDRPFFNGPFVALWASAFQPLVPRFLSSASLAHQYFIQGPGYESLRWGNLLLHAVVAWVLYLFAAKLIVAVTFFSSRTIELAALLSSLLFVVHPVAVYAVGYLVERSIVMATLGTLLMWLAWLNVFTNRSQRWLLVAVFAYYFAVFSKEHAILALAGPVALFLLLRPKGVRIERATVVAFLISVAIGILVIYQKRGLMGTLYEPYGESMLLQGVGPHLYLRSVLTQCGLYFHYLHLWIAPNPTSMSVDMREPLLLEVGAASAWAGVAAYIIYGIVATAMLLRSGIVGLLGFSMLMPWALFGTEFSSVRVQEIFVLYRSYLWFPTLAIPVSIGLAFLLERIWLKWIAIALSVAAAAYLVPATQDRLNSFTSSYAVWNDAVRLIETNPEMPMFAERAYSNRANALLESGYPRQALGDVEYSLRLNDRLCQSHLTRGRILAQLKRPHDAITEFSRTIELCPRNASAYFARFQVNEQLGARSAALADIHSSCELKNLMACFIETRLQNGVGSNDVFKFDVRRKPPTVGETITSNR